MARDKGQPHGEVPQAPLRPTFLPTAIIANPRTSLLLTSWASTPVASSIHPHATAACITGRAAPYREPCCRQAHCSSSSASRPSLQHAPRHWHCMQSCLPRWEPHHVLSFTSRLIGSNLGPAEPRRGWCCGCGCGMWGWPRTASAIRASSTSV